MDGVSIEWLRIVGFRCVRSVELQLTRLHALIGPNDSGKSSILSAIRDGAGQFWLSNGHFWSDAVGRATGRFPNAVQGDQLIGREARLEIDYFSNHRKMLRLEPDEMRRPATLIPQRQHLWFSNEKGAGLASLYDALLNRDRAAFIAIDERFRQLFPSVKALRLENTDSQTKALALTLAGGTEVGAGGMSEGMLYWLAFAIVDWLSPQAVILIEEPENGLHPARIAEVMRVLREVTGRTQVIVATHSPLVINELKPEEVTIVTRSPEHGTICTPMIATRNFTERSQVYALGELWLAYADGNLERELVETATEAAKAG